MLARADIDPIAGIAGDVQDVDDARQLLAGRRDLVAIDAARQADIGDQQVRAQAFFQGFQCAAAIAAGVYVMPLFFEHLADQQAQSVLVLHQQNYTGRCVNLLLRRLWLRAGLPGIVAAGPGQVEVDAGALLRFADNAQLAA